MNEFLSYFVHCQMLCDIKSVKDVVWVKSFKWHITHILYDQKESELLNQFFNFIILKILRQLE